MLMEPVESRLGSMETWPTSNLAFIFAYDPYMLNALPQLETVIAFFYDNGVPIQMACQFFIACNGHAFMHVKEQFRSLYEFWSRPQSRLYLNKCYYDMREGKYKNIDGSNTYYLDISFTPRTGFSGTGFPTIIRTILRRVCHLELEE